VRNRVIPRIPHDNDAWHDHCARSDDAKMAVRTRPFSEEIRPMDESMIATHFENIEHRLDRIEQFLPTLASKEELRFEIANAIAPLATKEELRLAIEPLATKEELRLAIEPLATKEELRLAIEPLATKEELHDLRRHMNVLFETLRADIQLLAEHVASLMPRRQN
jgi:hypothetical protein